ncbi:MAG: PAS domain-containing sensor histidine kinase [Nitrosomonadaceae bacterium]
MKTIRPGNDQSIRAQDDLDLSKVKGRKLFEELPCENNKDLYEFSPVGHLTLGQDGRIVEINITACEMLGLDRMDLIYRRISTFVDKDDQKRWGRLKLKLSKATSLLKADIRLHLNPQNNHKFYGHLFIRNRPIEGFPNGFEVVIIDITRQEQIANKNKVLKVSAENLRALLSHEIQIREDEQIRIGRNLHDQIGGDLAAIKSQILLAQDDVNSGRSPDAHLMATHDMAVNVIGSIRSTISRLHPPVLDGLGIWEALKLHSSLIRVQHEIDCDCILDPAIESIEPSNDVSAMIFRVVQEAITNVIRHAHASKIIIEAQRHSSIMRISIKDDGIGISHNLKRNKDSHGIFGMEERTKIHGGKFTIHGVPGKGTVVTLDLPLKQEIES